MIIKVILADDHTIVREGLRALLESQPHIEVIASVSNGREAVRAARELKPDVIVMDIAMPELNGIDAAEIICHERPETQVVILSIHKSSEHIYRALRAGAKGYLLKDSAGAELVEAIRTVHERRRYITQQIAETILDEYISQRREMSKRSPIELLSQREREVLQFVVEGLSSQEIAQQLSLSPRTVETYRSRIMQKLDLHDLPSLTKFAIENGLTTSQ